MGWTVTTTISRNAVTGQAHVTRTPKHPGLSASFEDGDSKPHGEGPFRFACDSPVEGAGFEPSVPREIGNG
jgi:hypothetical protein